jgi:hypothetical protein
MDDLHNNKAKKENLVIVTQEGLGAGVASVWREITGSSQSQNPPLENAK